MKKEYLIVGGAVIVIYAIYLLMKNKPKKAYIDPAKGRGTVNL